jgi:hypothetical protein
MLPQLEATDAERAQNKEERKISKRKEEEAAVAR